MRTLEGDFAPPGSKHIELVFRSVGERTSQLALELAIQHVKPQRVHLIEDVKPFALAVRRMLELPHATDPSSPCSHVVHMDADCLILEDMRPFLDANTLPYVDCYVQDRFRGRIHCGVHVTRADVVRMMATVPVPKDDLPYVLRPESRLRNLALAELGLEKQLKSFHILHDHFQDLADIFAKYALRELRSRTEFQRKRLDASMSRWGAGADLDVARHAVAHAARVVPPGAKPKHVEAYIQNLPQIAHEELAALGLDDQGAFGRTELERALAIDPSLAARPRPPKVFGLGLSRTGTRSLTAALHVLGIDTVHYPTDRGTLEALARGDGRFPLLDHYDGITDITTIPSFDALDRAYPDAKFVLTTRDEASWLKSCKQHWGARAPLEGPMGEEHRVQMEVRRRLREAVYGGYDFDATRFLHARRDHHERVMRHFAARPSDLLVLDIVAGDRWDKLAAFLGLEVPTHPFPHKGKKLSEKLASLEIDD
ncbi:MAG: hypothetical protein K1X94_32915 [Sandaracinaceae bacterium]|nr:hypothetical protein [Sandaracinaceae bacterium]